MTARNAVALLDKSELLMTSKRYDKSFSLPKNAHFFNSAGYDTLVY